MDVHEVIFKIKLKLAKTNDRRNKILAKRFWHIGDNSYICTDWFGNEPYLIWIGDNVIIAGGVRFNNHDASCWNAYRNLNIQASKQYEKVGPIILKNNCFIGANVMLLPNVVVGENSIVAAGAVVNRDIPPNEVWGGVPAKFIMDIDAYNVKMKMWYDSLPWNSSEKMRNIKEQRLQYFESRLK